MFEKAASGIARDITTNVLASKIKKINHNKLENSVKKKLKLLQKSGLLPLTLYYPLKQSLMKSGISDIATWLQNNHRVRLGYMIVRKARSVK